MLVRVAGRIQIIYDFFVYIQRPLVCEDKRPCFCKEIIDDTKFFFKKTLTLQ